MRPVDGKYTGRLVEQGNRVEAQLKDRITDDYPDVDFRRQGSVSNHTHIRYYSDVDVLVIIDKFFTLEPPQRPSIPYTGIPEDDLLVLRRKCVRELSKAFWAAEVDDGGANSISLSGGSLACKVDVVPSNWYHTNDYSCTGLECFKGIMILNKEEMKRKKNYPFLFNSRIDESDNKRNGVTRMLIRLLKTIRSDSEEEKNPIDFSSFDICSVVYRMPDEYLGFRLTEPLDIIRNLLNWMSTVLDRESIRNTLMVVDDSRKIFDVSGKTVEFRKLFNDLKIVYDGAVKESLLLNRSQLLTKAHIG